ncbi:hypothetical protein INR49_027063, partial [Caranx melampygus]
MDVSTSSNSQISALPLAQPAIIWQWIPCMARTAHPASTMLDWPAKHALLAWATTSSSFCPCIYFTSSPSTSCNTGACTNHNRIPSSSSSSSASTSASSDYRATMPALLARHPVPTSTTTSSNSSSGPHSSPSPNSSASHSSSPCSCSCSCYQHPSKCTRSVPYNLNLARGVYDKMMMTIMGHIKPNAKMFTVNFLRGNDIAFHINPRFSEGGKQVVVRNHKVGERWGPEERDLKGPFPFALGSPFEMKILCTQESFRVAVNNIPLFEFRHRVRELNQIDRINILHDVVLTFVNQLSVLLQQSEGLVSLTFDLLVHLGAVT